MKLKRIGDKNDTIAGKAIKAHKENVIRAKQFTLNYNTDSKKTITLI